MSPEAQRLGAPQAQERGASGSQKGEEADSPLSAGRARDPADTDLRPLTSRVRGQARAV